MINGLVSAGLGTAIQYLRDFFGETPLGEKISEHPLGQILATRKANENITFLEYLLGERPNPGKEGFTSIKIDGQELIITDSQRGEVEKIITLPDGEYAILRWNPEQKDLIFELTYEAQKAGWKVVDHSFIFEKPGVSGNIIQNWEDFKNLLLERGYKTQRVRWINFAYERESPKVISWEVSPDNPGFGSEGKELKMSWRPNPDGSVNVKVPVQGIAFNPKKEWNIEDYVRNGKAVLSLAPRDRELQHDSLLFSVRPQDVKGPYAEITIPREVAELFFRLENGKLKLNGAQLIYNLVEGEDDKGLKLISIAAQYNPETEEIYIPLVIEKIVPEITYTPPILPKYLVPIIPIPFIFDRQTVRPGRYRRREIPKPKPPIESEPYYYGYGSSYW